MPDIKGNSQAGLGQLAVILLLLAGVGLGTYLVQQRTNILPFAAEPAVPNGCKKITPGDRKVEDIAGGKQQITYTWSDGTKTVDVKGPLLEDGDRTLIKAESNKVIFPDGSTGTKGIANSQSGSYLVGRWSNNGVEYSFFEDGTNFQGIQGSTYVPSKSFTYVPITKGGTCVTGSTPKDNTKEGDKSKDKDKDKKKDSDKKKDEDKKTGTQSAKTNTTPATQSRTTTTPRGEDNKLVPLTFEDITGFRTRFHQLDTPLGNKRESGNLKIVYDIANKELDSLVADADKCTDKKDLDKCDPSLRKRFDLAKTAGRLAAFYGIYQGVNGICAKVDFGIDPLLTAKAASATPTDGRLNLCTNAAGTRIWKVLDADFKQLDVNTSVGLPANPSCDKLDIPEFRVTTHYRQAESLFENQSGFVKSTPCTGTTTTGQTGNTGNLVSVDVANPGEYKNCPSTCQPNAGISSSNYCYRVVRANPALTNYKCGSTLVQEELNKIPK